MPDNGAHPTWDRYRKRAEAEKESGPSLLLTRASDVMPIPVEWLWPGRIALGKLSIISGDPGLGKSMLSVALASHVTNGAHWPVNGEPCPKGGVIMLSAEDDPADTIRPRLDAAGADTSKVYFLDMVKDVDHDGEAFQRSFNISADLGLLDLILVDAQNCKLITIDPISAYMGPGTDSHKNTDVRALLKPLADIAQKHGVAVVVISHLNKGGGAAIYRTMGSLAFMAAARAGFIVVRDKDPSGADIPRDIEGRLRKLTGGAAFSFEREAILPRMINEYGLLTRPTKKTDSRSKDFDGESVELDALHPDILKRLTRNCIERHVDQAILDSTRRIEGLERESMLAMKFMGHGP